jgi:phosphatidylserine decarboxylase precursor-related protein
MTLKLKTKNNQLILEEGFRTILITLLVSLFIKFFISDFFGILGFILVLALIYIYRNPTKHSINDKDNIFCPIDGTINVIDIKKNKYIIYIDVSLCGTHKLRAPVEGNYKIKSKQNGSYLNPFSPKAQILNEQAVLEFEDVKMKIIAGLCNKEIVLYHEENVKAGDSIGVFLQGLVILEIPKTSALLVHIGDKVSSATNIIAKKGEE